MKEVKREKRGKILTYKRRKKERWRKKRNEKQRVKKKDGRKTYIERKYKKSLCFRINLKMIYTGHTFCKIIHCYNWYIYI